MAMSATGMKASLAKGYEGTGVRHTHPLGIGNGVLGWAGGTGTLSHLQYGCKAGREQVITLYHQVREKRLLDCKASRHITVKMILVQKS